MRPSPAEPSITIIGNSVPPPSMRCTLVSVGQANFPYSESSHARAASVLRTAIPLPHVALLRQVEHTHHHVAVAPFVVHVTRVEREREVMDLLGVEMDALACGRHGAALRPPVPRPVPAALIIDPQPRIGLGLLPSLVA